MDKEHFLNQYRTTLYYHFRYVLNLENKRQASLDAINQVRADRWVDNLTAAVILEFNTYNANTNLFTIVTFIFEFLETGVVAPYSQIITTRLFYYTEPVEILVAIFEVAFIIYIFALSYEQAKNLHKVKCKKYFRDPRNYIDMSVLIFSYTAFVLFFVRIVVVNEAVGQHHVDPHKFVSFYLASFCDSILVVITAMLQQLTIIKFLQLISFNPFTRIMAATLQHLIRPIAHYFIMMFIVVLAFSSYAMLAFGTKFEYFSNMYYTLMNLFSVFMGEFDNFDEFHSQYGTSAGIFFMVMVIIFYYVLLNIMLAVIVDGFYTCRIKFEQVEKEHDFYTFMWNRFVLWLGLGTPQNELILNLSKIKESEKNQLIRRRRNVRFAEGTKD